MRDTYHFTRRRLLASAAVIPALTVLSARAQLVTDADCTVGFVGGLVQFNSDCVLSVPGLAVAPPSHLVSLAQALDAPPVDTAEFRQRPGPRQRAKARAHQRRKRRHGRHHHGRGGGGHGSTVTTTPAV